MRIYQLRLFDQCLQILLQLSELALELLEVNFFVVVFSKSLKQCKVCLFAQTLNNRRFYCLNFTLVVSSVFVEVFFKSNHPPVDICFGGLQRLVQLFDVVALCLLKQRRGEPLELSTVDEVLAVLKILCKLIKMCEVQLAFQDS
jgi:hypothetical protein